MDGEPLDNGGADEALGDFTIRAQGLSLGAAADLGTIGSPPTVASGTLDFQDNPLAVQLYRFTLAPGHYWQFGAEVSAARDGGTLATELALFDAQGKLLATGDIGRPDDPTDPFLFAGLAPGIYYVGVSDPGNIPGQPRGYDPASGDPGGAAATQAGGPFLLHLAATPADAPTQLSSFNLNWADPDDPSPTGMTLAFSGPLSLDSLLGVAQGQSLQAGHDEVAHFAALQVVDQAGKAWPLTVVDYQEGEARLTFLFDEKLPAGRYTLLIPTQGGSPTWRAGPRSRPASRPACSRPGPSSPIAPRRTRTTWGPSIRTSVTGSGADTIAPGQSTSYRFVATLPGLYSFETQSQGGPLAVQLTGPAGIETFDGGAPGQVNNIFMGLTPGVYNLQLTATGSQPVRVDWVLSMKTDGWESVLSTGLSQGPALNLMLINPGGPAPGPQPSPSAISSIAPAASSSPSGTAGRRRRRAWS